MSKLNDSINMKKYVALHSIEYLSNYKNKTNTKYNNDLAEYIYNNYNTMDNYEMKIISSKCMDINEIKKTILAFEFKNYKPEISADIISLEEFSKKATKIIAKYQGKAGGFLIEDSEWTIHKQDSIKYEIRENELLFENTLSFFDDEDDETEEFLDCLISRLNTIASNIKVHLKFKEHTYSKVLSILLWITDINMKVDECIVGL